MGERATPLPLLISCLRFNASRKAFDTLARLCAALDCQPGDILEYRSEDEDSVSPTYRTRG